MSLKENTIIDEADLEMREEAGLTFVGRNAEGEAEWIGTNKAWDKYEKLINKKIIICNL